MSYCAVTADDNLLQNGYTDILEVYRIVYNVVSPVGHGRQNLFLEKGRCNIF